MLDAELIAEVRSTVRDFPDVRELPQHEASEVIHEAGKRHIVDVDRVWWWTSLRGECPSLSHEGSDGLEVLGSLLPLDAIAYLVITDDEPPPWLVLRGRSSELLAVLRDLRFCEYFIVSSEYDWIVFDTHDNTLVVAGDLVDKARAAIVDGNRAASA